MKGSVISKSLLSLLRSILRRFLKFLGLGILKYKTLETLETQAATGRLHFLEKSFIKSFAGSETKYMLDLIEKSKSQLNQEIFVLHTLNYKENGFFVEFGATDGIELSNTYLLESQFGWKGILSEPGKIWQENLVRNRPNSKIDFSCVWKVTGAELVFRQAKSPGLSTIEDFKANDGFSKQREEGRLYRVETVSLLDLLKRHNAPKNIDFLSIDTEGSELQILQAFDFSQYNIAIIVCEHNFGEQRDLINTLLTANGYSRVYEEISNVDDWFIKVSKS